MIDLEEIVLSREEDAKKVLDALKQLLNTHGSVSVADYLELVSISANFTDLKWGWRELDNVAIKSMAEGFTLDLPRPQSLTGEIFTDREQQFEERKDARDALIKNIRRDKEERGMSNLEIAEKHQISESSVLTLLDPNKAKNFDVYKVSVQQLGTDHRCVVTVVAPAGTSYRDVAEKIRREGL